MRKALLLSTLVVGFIALGNNAAADDVDEGPHFYDNACCYCKEATSAVWTNDGFVFQLLEGGTKTVPHNNIRDSVDGRLWWCPGVDYSPYAGECGLVRQLPTG